MVDPIPAIKHPRLSALFALWRQRKGSAAMPAADAMSPTDLRLWLGNLLIIDVVRGDDFVYRYYGEALADAFGTDMVGQSIASLPPDQRDILFAEYERVRDQKTPLARTYTALFNDGPATWERLVLPLTENGTTVAKLLVGAYRLEPSQAPWPPTHG